MSAPAWTSFDRYSRYLAIAEQLAAFSPPPESVADVGDGSGWLHLFSPDIDSFAIDLAPDAAGVPGAARVRGDGTRLPLADGAVDVVVSSDALEHVPPAARPLFLDELRRVARRGVVLAAPFDTIGVAGAEDLVRRWFVLSHGSPQPQLTEHAELGLPDLDATVAHLGAGGWTVRAEGNGNLLDWLGMMLARLGMEARPELRPLSEGLDVAYNGLVSGRRAAGPFYRHLVVATATPLAPVPVTVPEVDDATAAALVSQFGHLTAQLETSVLTASVAGIPPIVSGHIDARVAELQEHLTEVRRLATEAAVDAAGTRQLVIDLTAKVDALAHVVELGSMVGVAKRLRHRFRRGNGDGHGAAR